MNKLLTSNIWRLVIVLSLQLMLLKQISFNQSILSYMQFFIYPVIILMLPIKLDRTLTLLIAFVVGMIMDMFYDSPGVHAAAAVTTAYLRPFLLAWMEPYEGYNVRESPTMEKLGFRWYAVYLAVLLLTHLLLYFSIEAFSFVFIGDIMLNAIMSFIPSYLIIILGMFLFKPVN
jgi:hypothetical protein